MMRALPPPKPQLDYAAAPTRRRRWIRRSEIAAVILLVGLIVWRFAPIAWRQAHLVYFQNKCLRYTAPPDRIVCSPGQSIAIVPPEWKAFTTLLSPPGINTDATLFLHERISPAGNRRLVAVDALGLGRKQNLNDGLYSTVRTFKIGSVLRAPQELPSSDASPLLALDAGVFVYAGQPDPVDPSHFTIRAVSKSGETIIDGWLKDNDHVLIEPRPMTPLPATRSATEK